MKAEGGRQRDDVHPSAFAFRLLEFFPMLWLIFGCMIPSMIVCWAAAFAVRRWGPRFGLIDRPGARKIHAAPMPTAGGLAIWLGIVAPLALGHLMLWVLLPCATAGLPSSAGIMVVKVRIGRHAHARRGHVFQ